MCIHTYIDIVHLHRLGIIMIHCGNPHQLGHGISQVRTNMNKPYPMHQMSSHLGDIEHAHAKRGLSHGVYRVFPRCIVLH